MGVWVGAHPASSLNQRMVWRAGQAGLSLPRRVEASWLSSCRDVLALCLTFPAVEWRQHSCLTGQLGELNAAFGKSGQNKSYT